MNEKLQRLLRRALETSHPRALAELAHEWRMYQRTAAGISDMGQPTFRKVTDAIMAANFENERAIRHSPQNHAEPVTVHANRSDKK